MLCLARLMRCAMVASGTRNAFAISAVVNPPTARSVSAIAEAGVRAGWQHMNSSSRDRKSTRLNSSHITISYAVFCLKKKKKKKTKKKEQQQNKKQHKK